MKYLFIVGEASADLHAAEVMRAIKQLDAHAVFCFIGGDAMKAASNTEPLMHYRNLAVMGFRDVVRKWKSITHAKQIIQQTIASERPHVVVPVDYGGFNLRYTLPMAKHAHCAVLYLIPPKVWATRPQRIKQLKKRVDLALTIFPFEAEYLQKRGVRAEYIGNPSAQELAPLMEQSEELSPTHSQETYVALLPGSRKSEIRYNLPVMLQSLTLLNTPVKAVIAGAPGTSEEDYHAVMGGAASISNVEVSLLFGATQEILKQATCAVVTSGTATLEAALLNVPQVVCYKTPAGKLPRILFRHFASVKHFSLVNIVAQRPIVTELLADYASPTNIAHALTPLLDLESQEVATMRDGYRQMKQKLLLDTHHSPAQTAAEYVYQTACLQSDHENQTKQLSL